MTDLRYWVPTCPRCYSPLAQADGDDTKGACVSLHCPSDGQVFTRGDWTWLHQSVFNGSDLPPWNGWLPINVEAV